ncbi:MAG: prolyl-tRNA synthetase [Chlamydiales bacterium]|jgi:prolyl-tRNA synthetase
MSKDMTVAKESGKKSQKNAISPSRQEDYPEWYQQVVKAADLAENAPVRGCMIIKPWGYGIWERIQRQLDDRIKASGHENAYFPLFIPVKFLEKEAAHVDGFAKECAVVTHSRLEEKDGKLVPCGPLEEPLIVRPTSETIIGHSFSKWVQSHRDLPLLINQWANIVRWEMRTRLFLRTSEFLWQEGHTAHSTSEEAIKETTDILEMYREFLENVLAIPVITGVKSETEKFPGAEVTYCFEAMMQDKKALQGGTSHYLGQNFAKAFEIDFLNKDGKQEHVYTTSWGVTTRLIGALVMAHSDDDGLRLPPRIAPKHVVIVPFLTKPDLAEKVLAYAEDIAAEMRNLSYHGSPIIVHIDKRDLRGGEKNWEWIKKGIPLRIEVGPRDMDGNNVCLSRRDQGPKEKTVLERGELAAQVCGILDEIQENYYNDAKAFRDANITEEIQNFEDFTAYFTPKNKDKPEIHGGFVKGKWCENAACEEKIGELKVSIRCLPLEQSGTAGKCVICGSESFKDVIYAKSY